ncbi:MAG: hypothetical protein ACLRRT_13080 [Ruthenibacterium lactatiformans]
MVEFYNKLWTEGLVDRKAILRTRPRRRKGERRPGGLWPAQNTQWMGAAAEYCAVPRAGRPLRRPRAHQRGEQRADDGRCRHHHRQLYPEATMRWLDYFYSEEGTVLCRLGIEGEGYEVVDGKYQLLDNIKNNPDGLTLDQALGQWAIFRAATCLSISPTSGPERPAARNQSGQRCGTRLCGAL